ncbi:MAG: phytoene/squalene synthase family protein [Bacteroidetes bacterium]|nr:phytoene/squalene synthase family protein [Bacteroidota bacterium]
MIALFHKTSSQCSKITVQNYSNSFATAIRLLHKDYREDIRNIYGFVRFADEIVDSFHSFDKAQLLASYQKETYLAIQQSISLNPILHSFQRTINKYQIDLTLVDAFFKSMQADLDQVCYDENLYKEYIYGSAEVVGLMCLTIFCNGDTGLYEQLKKYAQSFGAALQKVNFLRDMKSDHDLLNRIYFPNCNFNQFNAEQKSAIESDIQNDFDNAYKGIMMLPAKSRLGVFVAYRYYLSLFKKIKKLKPATIFEKRIRINGYKKIYIAAKASLQYHFNIL